tara:strand:- start:176 stop:784 length:609 start_codon:yes stop_codon:yes gene_type:complete
MALVKYNNNSISAITAAASIPSGGLNLITTNTISSGVSSSSFTSGIDSTYNTYIFKFINIHPSESSDFAFNLRDGGTDFDATKTTTSFFSYHSEDNSGQAGPQYDTGDDHAQATGYQKLNVSSTWGTPSNDQSISGVLHLFDPSNTTFVKHFFSRSNLTVDYSLEGYIGGYANVTAAIDGVDFKFESGNIDSGVIKMYGITK